MAQVDPGHERWPPKPSENVVWFGRVKRLLDRMADALDEKEREAFRGEIRLAKGFLSMFPEDFHAPVPYPIPPDCETGETAQSGNPSPKYVFAVTSPPKRWP